MSYNREIEVSYSIYSFTPQKEKGTFKINICIYGYSRGW